MIGWRAHCIAVASSLLVGSAASGAAGLGLYVSSQGSGQGVGSRDEPFAALTAARDAIRGIRQGRGGQLPKGGITVWIRGGAYHFDRPLVLTAEDAGTEQAPIVYRAYPGEEVVFDGSNGIDPDGFEIVADRPTLDRLASRARGNVVARRIDDPAVAKALASGATLSIDGKMMQYARFPDVGFAHVRKILDRGAVYAHGRTKGKPPSYSMEDPIGGEITIREEPSGRWEDELKINQNARVRGYLAYDWYRQSHRIARIGDGRVKLLEYSRYGIRHSGKMPRRLVVTGLLCEVDQPGEWYFDDRSNMLFIWPFEPMGKDTTLGTWAGPSFAILRDTAYTTIRDLTITGVADRKSKAMVYVVGGHHNLIAGCTFKNATRTAIWIEGGHDNGIRGCDIYDVAAHLNLYGGDTKTLTPARNFAINCHFTQVQATDFYGRIAVRGVGQIFRNNLVHNFIGQPITPGGNDQIIELNEVFNVGIEEGDGGAMYTAQAMWGGYGQVFRHNFLHHLMCVPQAHPRGGIYLDQLYGGSRIEENVFYKGAHRAVLVNGGAGTTIARNVFVNGHIGIYNTSAYAQKAYEAIPRYDSGEFKRGDVGDYIWRTERAIGKEGWNQEPWRSRFPLFSKIMNQTRMRFYPIESKVVGNLFCGNVTDMLWNPAWRKPGITDLSQIDALPYIECRGNRSVAMDLFDDPVNMSFALVESDAVNLPRIPFEKIGLLVDEYRKSVPDKRAYRVAVMRRFAKRPSFDPDAKYDPATVNELLYFNTGKLLLDH